jgi:5-methylcytosine-specific restriction endonuclease McrA
MTDRAEELRREDSEHWWRQYNTYLESPEWKARRKAVLERDEFLCQGCRKQRATQVHHLTYDRKGNEMLFDLVAVCDECHEAIHPND